MNKAEIANVFIRAAYIDSRLPDEARPKRLKGASLPFFHSDSDIKERRVTGIRSGKEKEHLLPGDNPLDEWRAAFWEGLESRISRNDVRLWELANELVKLVADESNRRCLWAWAASKVGTLQAHETKKRVMSKKLGGEALTLHKRTRKDVSFTAWCRSEGIHEMTGSRRKDRALAVIEQYFVRGSLPNTQSGGFALLPVGPVFEHIADTIADDAPANVGRTFERDQDTVFSKEAQLFEWREFRNARRRQLLARRKTAA